MSARDTPDAPPTPPTPSAPSAQPAHPAPRIERLRARLTERFHPTVLEVLDESHRHQGHAGAADGRGHFRVRIVSAAFRGLPPLARHRLVFAALEDLMRTDIHALALDAQPPQEA
jgi:BolA protein